MINGKEAANKDVVRKGKNKFDVAQYILVDAKNYTKVFDSCA